MPGKKVKVGLLGLGIVGGGVARLLTEEKKRLSERLGAELVLTRAADLRPEVAQELGLKPPVFTTNADEILDDPSVDIVVELLGGLEPARSFIMRALEAGKQVATANKALLAHHGAEIFQAARRAGVSIAYEGAV
ncbi:MAG: homoserine dehydrogenase, partial [Desulfarculaceae bacterium]